MQYICSLKAAGKHVKENLRTSVKILQICMDLQDSVQRSLQNPAEKILLKKSCRSAQIRKDRKPGFSLPKRSFDKFKNPVI